VAAHENLGNQFKVFHQKLGEGVSPNRGWHALTLHDVKEGRDLARVSFEHYNDPNIEPSSRIDIDYLKSYDEGKGHAQRLMEHMYNRYPKSFIDWGLTINPASTHIASKFEDKYYDRTAYQPESDLD
jgi:hypothetical protein